MKRYLVLSLVVAAAALLGAEPPNILLIIADDLGWKDLGCTGSSYHETPNIDQLAAEGIRFKRAYSASVICTPSRSAILTGRHPARTKMTCVFNGDAAVDDRLFESSKGLSGMNQTKEALHRHALSKDDITIGETLQKAGYATAWFGKWHLGSHRSFSPDQRGFQVAKGYRTQHVPTAVSGHWGKTFKTVGAGMNTMGDEDYVADVLTDECIGFIRDHQEQPFFAVLSHYLVHYPFTPKPESVAKFINKPGNDQNHPEYAAMVSELDDSVGRVIATLEKLGLRENTLIVFTSDNGGVVPKATSTYPLLGGKALLFEGGTRVPLIVNWKGGLQGDRIVTERVIGTDLYPTFLAAAGVAVNPDQPLDGINLMPVLNGQRGVAKRPLYFHYPHYTKYVSPASSILDGRWKLMRFYNDAEGEFMLFDLEQDPGEQHDLSAEHPEVVSRLADSLQKTLVGMDAEFPTPNANYNPHGEKNSNRATMYEMANQFRNVSKKKLRTSAGGVK